MNDQQSLSTLDQWRVLSPLLDKALELDGEARSNWIRSQDPEFANQLEDLLREHESLANEGFLEDRGELPPTDATLAGQSLGVYALVSQIGQGGMGSVWLAERNDGRFERQVAIKFLNLALMGKAGEERFRREGRILALLAHQILQISSTQAYRARGSLISYWNTSAVTRSIVIATSTALTCAPVFTYFFKFLRQ